MDQTYQVIQYVHFFPLTNIFTEILDLSFPLCTGPSVGFFLKSHPCVSLYLYPGDFVSYICVEISVLQMLCFYSYIALFTLYEEHILNIIFFHFLQLFSIILRNMVFIMHCMCTYLFKPRICSK